MTIEELLTNSDWAQVFGEDSDYGSPADNQLVVEPTVHDTKISLEKFKRKDVKKIIASIDGERDEASWIGIFKLKDGRFALMSGSCDYTGWDCQSGTSCNVASKEEFLHYLIGDADIQRLGIKKKIVALTK